jgi:hypothetical protein
MGLDRIFDYLSIPLLISLAILLLLVMLGGCYFLYTYFNNKINDQNHKLNSMVGLVSTMAQEIHGGGSKNMMMDNSTINDNHVITLSEPFQYRNDIIDVSDDDEDEDLEDDLEEDDEDEDEDDDIEDLDEEEDEDLEDHEHVSTKESDIKVIMIEPDNLPSSDDVIIKDSLFQSIQFLKDPEQEPEQEKEPEQDQEKDHDSAAEYIDYKKWSINKLKAVVVEKGLVADASKLKKYELLKLLGVTE